MKLIVAMTALGLLFGVPSVYADSDDSHFQRNQLLNEIDDEYVNHVKSSDRYSSHVSSKFHGSGATGFPSRIKPPGERIFVFSPRLQAWAAYLPDGTRVGYGRANGGSGWCADLGRPCRTPGGKYRVRSKGVFSCKSSKFPRPRGGAPMPYCMFFHGGYAIHGSPYLSNANNSHGCIRVQTRAAQWLSRYFIGIGTKVVILPYR